ncbi:hypothetical protein D9756_005188 [Leucocoprinus leucothites]|uniref:Uncharacterized protein n=1 Tax=Leucocoprinus leucothites TaxID=201217 RepID=A0A8H5LKD6_9AGAR|nr:hypothetical protein D9756_005188 [Leucoagaricus leucothites]
MHEVYCDHSQANLGAREWVGLSVLDSEAPMLDTALYLHSSVSHSTMPIGDGMDSAAGIGGLKSRETANSNVDAELMSSARTAPKCESRADPSKPMEHEFSRGIQIHLRLPPFHIINDPLLPLPPLYPAAEPVVKELKILKSRNTVQLFDLSGESPSG